MFETPNGQKFLGMLSKLARAAEDIADEMKKPCPVQKAEPHPWTKRDQIALELFKDTLRGDDLTSENYVVAVDATNRAIENAYELAELFMAKKRTKAWEDV